MIDNTCNNIVLKGLLSITRRILLLIQIIAPIVLLIFATIALIKMMYNPDEKNGLKNIINKFIAAVIIFIIPIILDALMIMLSENTKLSSCWNEASENIPIVYEKK